MVDYSKLKRHALHQVAPLTSFDAVSSDSDVPVQRWREQVGRAEHDVNGVAAVRALS